jgi:hypothetical protein
VFCNAAKSSISYGVSCLIRIESTNKPHNGYPGIIETLTPYHGWRKGILTARADGALSEADQALVVADIDPVHVVSGKPRPQLLPEPMALAAYLPVVELLDPDVNKVNLYRALWRDEGKRLGESPAEEVIHAALSTVSTEPETCKEAGKLWKAFEALKGDSGPLDGSRLDTFARFFPDPGAVRERLRVWERDRCQQPHPNHGALRLEPAWLDFLDVDLTLGPDEPLPYIIVPPWSDNIDTTAAGATAS